MPRSVIALSLILSAVVVAADAPPPTPPAPKSAQRAAARNARPAPDAPPSPEEAGRLLVEQKCGKCHDASRATGAMLSEASWKAHMKRMGKFPGAAITEEQAKQIHEYLKATAAP
jgi:cytochrome c5